MSSLLSKLTSLGRELRRRRVVRAGALYVAGSVALLEAADLVLPVLGASSPIFPLLVVATITGFPVALVLAWVYEVTEDGIRPARESTPRGLRAAFTAAVVLASGGAGAAAWGLWLAPTATGTGDRAEEARRGLGAGTVAAGLRDEGPLRVGVLYFDDHSPAGGLRYLADGLTEGLIHELARVQGIEVVSRHGVKPFREGELPLDSVVRALGLTHVVEGSVARADGRLKVTVQLVSGATGVPLASHVLERVAGDLFALQDTVAFQVSRMLRERLGVEVRRESSLSGATNPEAWSLLRRALLLVDDFRSFQRDDPAAAERALLDADSLLARAEELDPEWVEPVVERGRVALLLARFGGDLPGSHDEGWLLRALSRAAVAVALDSAFAPAHHLQGEVLAALARSEGTAEASALLERAEAALRTAVGLDPDDAEVLWGLSRVLLDRGRAIEAHRAALRALEADAFLEVEAGTIHQLYYTAINLERLEEAGRWCREGRRRFPRASDFVVCRLFLLASAPAEPRDVELVWRLQDTLLTLVRPANRERFRSYGTLQVAKVVARAGLTDSARAVRRRVRETAGDPGWLAYDEAHLSLLLGERDEALRHLERYVAFEPSASEFLATDWWFRLLWEDPGFRRLTSRR